MTVVLSTKLSIPPIHSELVPRPRLIKRLHGGRKGRLTLVSAPAGFGKTVLTTSWVKESREPVGWLSLDKEDNDPLRFLSYLLRALPVAGDTIDDGAIDGLAGQPPPALSELLGKTINQIAAHQTPFLLVLDDYHVIQDETIHGLMQYWLEHQPDPMHLVIVTRTDPPWMLARLRARGELNEVRSRELRFTLQETSTFLRRVMKIDLSAEQIASLDNRLEGWIAGLQLLAVSLQGRRDIDGFIQSFSGSHRYVFDYLMEEVLQQQPADIEDFLIQTSILQQLNASLCVAVTGISDSHQILIELEQSNLFLLPLDEEREWYRYHHLFAELLQGRLAHVYPHKVAGLHSRASTWFEQHAFLERAVIHAVLAGNFNRAAFLVAQNALAMIDRPGLKNIARQMDALSSDVLQRQPWLRVALAWVTLYLGRLGSATLHLQAASQALTHLDDKRLAEEKHIRGHLAAVNSYVLAFQGEMGPAVKSATTALDLLPQEDGAARGMSAMILGTALRWQGDLAGAEEALLRSRAINRSAGNNHVMVFTECSLAEVQIQQGRLRQAALTIARVLEQQDSQQKGDPNRRFSGKGLAYARLSTLELEWDRLDAASNLAQKGLDNARYWGQMDVLITCHLNLATVLQAKGEIEAAAAEIERAKQLAAAVSPWYQAYAGVFEAELWLANNELDKASWWAEKSNLRHDDEPDLKQISGYLTLARVLIAQGNPSQATSLLARLRTVAESSGAIGYVIEAGVLQAVAWQTENEDASALTALEKALSLAEPEGYVHTFIKHGNAMAKLLRNAVAAGIATTYSTGLLAALENRSRYEVPTDPLQLDLLTDREMMVLRLLATNLSIPEIAGELGIAPSTVRTHVKNIYSKLDVHSRFEAVTKASESKWL